MWLCRGGTIHLQDTHTEQLTSQKPQRSKHTLTAEASGICVFLLSVNFLHFIHSLKYSLFMSVLIFSAVLCDLSSLCLSLSLSVVQMINDLVCFSRHRGAELLSVVMTGSKLCALVSPATSLPYELRPQLKELTLIVPGKTNVHSVVFHKMQRDSDRCSKGQK